MMTPSEEQNLKWLHEHQDTMTEEENAKYWHYTSDLVVAEVELQRLYRKVRDRVEQ